MDIVHDVDFITWVKIASTYDKFIPDYVRKYIPLDQKTANSLPDDLFADNSNRLFPINSKENVWLSAAYFAKNAEKLNYAPVLKEHILNNIKRAAAIFGIEQDVNTIIEAIHSSPIEKQAKDDLNNYGLVLRDNKTNALVKKYPMFDELGVKKAINYFFENLSKYPQPIREKIAKAIVKKAEEFNVPVPDALWKEAGYGVPDPEFIAQELDQRIGLAKDAETAAILNNLKLIVFHSPVNDLLNVIDKIASAIEAFDRGAGLVVRYGRTILTPSEVVYSMSIKQAKQMIDEAIVLDKHAFQLSKLAKLPKQVYEDVFGKDFVNRILDKAGEINPEKLADELYSLPHPDKRLLEQYLKTL